MRQQNLFEVPYSVINGNNSESLDCHWTMHHNWENCVSGDDLSSKEFSTL